MWRRMMRVWLVGAAVTVGSLDGLPEAAVSALAVRGDVAGRDGAADGCLGPTCDGDLPSRRPQLINT